MCWLLITWISRGLGRTFKTYPYGYQWKPQQNRRLWSLWSRTFGATTTTPILQFLCRTFEQKSSTSITTMDPWQQPMAKNNSMSKTMVGTLYWTLRNTQEKKPFFLTYCKQINKKYLFILCCFQGPPLFPKLDFGLWARVFSVVLLPLEPTIPFSHSPAVSHSKSRDFRFPWARDPFFHLVSGFPF